MDTLHLPCTDPQGFFLGVIPLRVHEKTSCAGEACCLHDPSEHPLRDAPMLYRGDRGFIERTCDHAVGHPDPDSLAYLARVLSAEEYDRRAYGVHGCDGCCR